MESNLVGCAESPELRPGDKKAPTMTQRIKSLGLKKSTGFRLLKNAKTKRKCIRRTANAVSWSAVKKRVGYRKVSVAIRKKVYDWAMKHPLVVHSPFMNDSLLIRDPENLRVKIRVPKLLLSVCYRELHNDMLSDGALGLPEARKEDGTPLINDTALRALLPPQIRTMSPRYKVMCGCEVCIIMDQQHRSANSYRLKLLRKLEKDAAATRGARSTRSNETSVAIRRADEYKEAIFSNGSHLYPRPKDALGAIMCPMPEGHDTPRMRCILRRCTDCPEYTIPREELALGRDDPGISFHIYQNYSRCTYHSILDDTAKFCQQCAEIPEGKKKGRFSRRKQLTSLRRPLAEFYRDFYFPMLEKYAYHRPHYILLGKYETGGLRKAALKPGDVDSERDYAESLTLEANNQIQSEHFGDSRNLYLEGCFCRTFKAEVVRLHHDGRLEYFTDEDIDTAFHCHLSDDNTQNASSTHAHMDLLISRLMAAGVLRKDGTFWDTTDGCSKQYRCATCLYLLSMLSFKFGITINRAVSAPGHGKGKVDTQSGSEKTYLRLVMRRVAEPEEDDVPGQDKKIDASAVEEGQWKSLAEEAARLLSERGDGLKGGRKHRKREEALVVKKRYYHVRKWEDVRHRYLKYQMSKGSLPKGEYNGLRAMYNIYCDPDLGVGIVALRRIACACDACEEFRNRKWVSGLEAQQQPRFTQNRQCKYWPVMEGLNDWTIVKLVETSAIDPDDVEEAKADVLEGVATRMAEEIEEGQYGAVITEDEDTHGYYLVAWASGAYTLQEETDEYQEGELVAEATYFNPVGAARNWYTPSTLTTLVRVQHVVAADVNLLSERESTVKLPSSCNREQAREKGAMRITDTSHEIILDEINRRDSLDYVEHGADDTDRESQGGDEASEEGKEDSEQEESSGEGGVNDDDVL